MKLDESMRRVGPHPRLFLPAREVEALSDRIRTDTAARRIFACLRREAEAFLDAPVNHYVKIGPRLLAVSRSCQERILTLAAVARLEGDTRCARRAVEEMLAAAAFPDWNPSHFLDTAEMTFALAVGYDWLRESLSDGEREVIAEAIRHKGIEPSLDAAAPHNWWLRVPTNWNQVCHAGMAVGALALAERDPALCARVVERAVACVPLAAAVYAPDGAYPEGAMYWGYGTMFHVALISALESALGHDGGLADAPGFLESARYLAQVTAPGGDYFNYADCRLARPWPVALPWFARRLGEPGLIGGGPARLDEALARYEQQPDTDEYRLLALALIWHPATAADGEGPAMPLHWLGRGETPVAVHRSAWDDPRATFVGLKGGSPSTPHAHMDGGSFVLEIGGVRWAIDLGMQEYASLEGAGVRLWDARQEGERWGVFRLGSQGHGVPMFNGRQPRVDGRAEIVRFEADGVMPHTVADLSTLYAGEAARVWRGVGLLPGGSVLLQDEWTAGERPAEGRWQMLTRARVEVGDGEFILHQDGRRLRLRMLEPVPEVHLETVDVSAPARAFDAPNPGVSAVVLTCLTPPGRTDTLRLLAALDGVDEPVPPCSPLAQWRYAQG